MPRKIPKEESRNIDQLRKHYEVEKELADRLRKSEKEERTHLYNELYEELFRRVPNHPQLVRKADENSRNDKIDNQMSVLKNYLDLETVFLEVGAGDCSLSLEVAKRVAQVYAVDVSETIARNHSAPRNFALRISDGCTIDVPSGAVTLAYSNQLMEHLHPEDAKVQLRNIYNSLRPGGRYLCITPNRLTGPHDISKYFDDIARGFHMKEYTVTELAIAMKDVGFKTFEIIWVLRGRPYRFSIEYIQALERVLQMIPRRLSRPLACRFFDRGTIALVSNKVG